MLAAWLSGLMVLGALPARAQQAPAQAQTAQSPTQVRLPSMGESASEDLTVGAERRLGEQIMREARRDPEYLDDPVLLEYLQSVFAPLVTAARQLGNIDADTDRVFAWEPFLVRDRSVNAFALPGGFIGVHLGMIAITSNADQLASVLAHELSHVTQRHIARSIAPQQRASIVALAAILLGILAASRTNNADVANAAIMGGQGAAIQSQLNYSRDFEREADRVGFGVLATAGYASSGMAAMFEKLDVATRLNDNGGFPYLRTHPLTTDRISEARNRTLLNPTAPQRPTLLHALMQARSRVLMAEGNLALQRLAASGTSPLLVDRVAALYAGSLASSQLNDHAKAESQAAQAVQMAERLAPRQPMAERSLYLLQAEVRLARGDAPGALQALDAVPAASTASTGSTGSTPTGRPPMLLRAQAALLQSRTNPTAAAQGLRESTEALQTWLAEQPQDPAAWELAALTSEALGLKLRSMRAAAEARAVVGDLTGAIDRLRAAQAASRTAAGQDFIEASVIDARLRQITALRRQLALEARGEGRGTPRDGPPEGDPPPPQ